MASPVVPGASVPAPPPATVVVATVVVVVVVVGSVITDLETTEMSKLDPFAASTLVLTAADSVDMPTELRLLVTVVGAMLPPNGIVMLNSTITSLARRRGAAISAGALRRRTTTLTNSET